MRGPEAGEPGAHSPDSCWEVRRRQHSGKRWLAAPDYAPILFPPPEGVSRATPTSRLCTLHHNRADVTEKLSPPPPKTQGPELGRGCCPCCGFSVHHVVLSGGNLYVGVGGGVKRFLVCHVGKRRPSREIRLENNLGPLGKKAKVLKLWGPDGTMLTRTPE